MVLNDSTKTSNLSQKELNHQTLKSKEKATMLTINPKFIRYKPIPTEKNTGGSYTCPRH